MIWMLGCEFIIHIFQNSSNSLLAINDFTYAFFSF